MGQLTYHATVYDKGWLERNCFFYSRVFSDPDDPVYIHRFPAYRWGLITTLEAEMRLYTKDGTVTVDVYDGSYSYTRGFYAPFYYDADECHKDFVEEVIKTINKECKRLGFVEG